MHAIAINGGPRKTYNTAALLNHALNGAKSVGATTEMVNLYDLAYHGCTSCFACKRRDKHSEGCALKDELSPVLEKVLKADVLLLGSPIYFSDVTGQTRSFIERLLFPFVNYNDHTKPTFDGKIATACFFTMNLPEVAASYYKPLFDNNTQIFGRMLKGGSEYLASYDTYQFADYEKYNAEQFDEPSKRQLHEARFPMDCQKAFDIGERLCRN